jgi:PAS domain S-box-containing protein
MTHRNPSGKQAGGISARQWQAIFEAVNDAVWLLDNDMRVVRSNKAAARIFERETDSMLGRHCWEILHGTKEPVPECPVLCMRRSLKRESMELRRGERFFSVTADPILNAENKVTGAVHIVSDITERRRHEIENARLARMYATLSQINRKR